MASLLGELRLPIAAHGRELYDAPDIVVTRDAVHFHGAQFKSTSSLREQGRVTPIRSLIEALAEVRESWMTLNPEMPRFHGATLLWIDESTPALVVKSVVLSVAAAGFPNQSFVARRPNASAYGRILVDGRVSANWGREPRNEAELYVELLDADSARLSWRGPIGTLDTPNTVSLAELPLAIEREWKARGAHSAETDPAFDRATVSIPDAADFALMLRVFDALAKPQRKAPNGSTTETFPAFGATIAVPENELPQFLVR